VTVPRFVAISAVLEMLDECAEGHTRRLTDHGILVKWRGRVVLLPRGAHGRIESKDIGTSKVRTLVAQFGIADCAGEALPALAASFR
jgi:hypothetical protein